MAIQGIAKSARNPFSTTFVDDNVAKKDTGMYIGIIFGVSVLGPVVAFGLGGFISRQYVTLQDVPVNPRHPAWIGAWWIGFVIVGFASILVSLPLFCFPRRFPRTPHKTEENRRQSFPTRRHQFIEFLSMIARLVKNEVYMPLAICMCLKLFGMAGFVAFIVKYVEVQFYIPAWKANMLIGFLNIVIAALGTVIGGFLVSKRKLSAFACVKVVLTMSLTATVFASLNLLFGCENADIVGFNLPERSFGVMGKNVTCDKACGCSSTIYFPVCGSDNINYMNPCQAGCMRQHRMMFTDCKCIASNATAIPGLCDKACNRLYPFIANTTVLGLLASLSIIPFLIIKLRSVQESDRSMAIGFSSLLNTLVGWLLGPVVFGNIIDSTCLVWNTSRAGKGACAIYDNDAFRIRLVTMHIAAFGLSSLFAVILYFKAKKKKNWSGDDKQKVTKQGEPDETEVGKAMLA